MHRRVSVSPPALISAAYGAAYKDVRTYGRADGDPARDALAAFWLAEGGTPRETGTWFQALLVIVERQGTGRDLSATARLFALVGMAIGDAVAVSWQTKATYFTWRPAVTIPEADLDGNPQTEPDPTWAPRNGSVGASPEYTSGTSTSRALSRRSSSGSMAGAGSRSVSGPMVPPAATDSTAVRMLPRAKPAALASTGHSLPVLERGGAEGGTADGRRGVGDAAAAETRPVVHSRFRF